MSIIYDIVYLAFIIICAPVFLLRRKLHADFSLRLGRLPGQWGLSHPVWVHGVSVGEMAALRPLVEQLHSQRPRTQLFLTTVTPTGNKIARSLAAERDIVSYLPLDLSFIMRRVVNRVDPQLVIIAETEFWPNFLSVLAARHVPVVVVNGRISDRSLAKYRLVRLLLRPLLSRVKMFCMQSELDSSRLRSLGVQPGRIMVSGNLKFDVQWPQIDAARRAALRRELGLGEEQPLLIAASTHAGEEEALLRIYRGLVKDYPGLRLLIAVRHPQRGAEAAAAAQRQGLSPLLFSREITPRFHSGDNVLVLDVVGRLMDVYPLADLVFVGGSLVQVGGHNILEPAYSGRPVVFGRYMHNFRSVAQAFLAEQAAVQVADEAGLARQLRSWLADPSAARATGERGRFLLQRNRGAAQRCMEIINQVIRESEGQHA